MLVSSNYIVDEESVTYTYNKHTLTVTHIHNLVHFYTELFVRWIVHNILVDKLRFANIAIVL